jgi:hypothetical protein
MNLRFDDFNIIEGAMGIVVGRRAFHSAIWNNCAQLTLAVSADCNQISGVTGDMHQMSGAASGALNPIAEFCDLVPNNYLPLMPSTQIRMVQGMREKTFKITSKLFISYFIFDPVQLQSPFSPVCMSTHFNRWVQY